MSDPRRPFRLRPWFWIIVLAGTFALATACATSDESSSCEPGDPGYPECLG